jgi:hypothetical protein
MPQTARPLGSALSASVEGKTPVKLVNIMHPYVQLLRSVSSLHASYPYENVVFQTRRLFVVLVISAEMLSEYVMQGALLRTLSLLHFS